MKDFGKILALMLGLGLHSCADESSFSGSNGSQLDQAEPVVDLDATPEPPPEDIPVDPIEVIESVELLDYQLEAKNFAYGQPDTAIDYVFVIDNSVSMGSILNLVQQGFSSLVADNVFPPNSQVAVMSTMIGDPNNFNMTNSLLSAYTGMEYEPGFLDFVYQGAIQNYRDLVPGQAGKWAMDGCNNRWFKPNEKNAAGNYCLIAATQSTFSALGGEPGITAYEHLMLKNAGQQTFRTNAIVNIIYVSDTHDPGFNRQELIDNRKNFNQLDQLTRASNQIQGLKFHAMAPASRCSGENLYDLSYYTLVDAAKGQKADSCVTADYTEFLKKMVESSQVAEPRFVLNKPIRDVLKVKVNGTETKDYEIHEDKQSIIISGLDPKVPVTVDVIYSTPNSAPEETGADYEDQGEEQD
ncbi:hypothetical protein [Pseudobacteriovorax antillogorgiicola]|uniref:Uncharacterized protein n=1 Tax=Pseudobacteriovorax antillogorgiicola TaxID=1513793 RepID=A0A1Y6BU14_9BACT|nr:hypothetical protein [Pseudobacteriovorax antillogorgiicola]TCS52462.1 hypothetical protein EDD56_109207 [Pseudobacteriovorax antillogorgiicola]SMF28433.1 hypothetical protein SAMN06296036_1098 [Pseudobacteriovorax antillogorgiicola]